MTMTVSAKGQLVIPAALRKRYHLGPKTKVDVIDTGHSIVIKPVVKDPFLASRGLLKGKLTTEEFLRWRREERAREAETQAKPYVLDTSAVVAYLAQESGSDRVRELKSAAALPFLALTELYDVVCRKHNVALADRSIEEVLGWHLPLPLPDQHLSIAAGIVKAQHQLGLLTAMWRPSPSPPTRRSSRRTMTFVFSHQT